MFRKAKEKPVENVPKEELVEQMKMELQEIYGDEIDDVLRMVALAGRVEETLQRFLMARQWDVKKATKMLQHTIEWRQDQSIGTYADHFVLPIEKLTTIRRFYVS